LLNLAAQICLGFNLGTIIGAFQLLLLAAAAAIFAITLDKDMSASAKKGQGGARAEQTKG
jgi:hypothetical protein